MDIENVRQTALTDTTFGISFNTNLPATSYIRYGTSSGNYTNNVDIATSQTQTHAITLTGLTQNTVYYFTIRVTSDVDAINRPEDYFITLQSDGPLRQLDGHADSDDTPVPARYHGPPVPNNCCWLPPSLLRHGRVAAVPGQSLRSDRRSAQTAVALTATTAHSRKCDHNGRVNCR